METKALFKKYRARLKFLTTNYDLSEYRVPNRIKVENIRQSMSKPFVTSISSCSSHSIRVISNIIAIDKEIMSTPVSIISPTIRFVYF